MHPAYRGGRRGGKPSRGGSRGPAGNHGLRPNGSTPTKNRGHNGSSHIPSNGVASATPNSAVDPSGPAAVVLSPAPVPGQATFPAKVPAAPRRPPPRKAWCELCKVDCNRLEILEQHNNGKRHKRNLKKHEELQKKNKVITGKQTEQSVQVPNLGSEVVQLEKVEGSKENHCQKDTSPSLAITTGNKKETEQQDIVNKSEVSRTDPPDAKRKSKDPSEARSRGIKRKIRGGRGGKYRKSNEGSKKPVDPPKPKAGIPFVCELCNVKCESQVVFNSHLAGKKHIANMKSFHGHRSLHGEEGLQSLYPPNNINAPSPSFIPQIQQGLADPQVVLAQLLSYVLSQAQVPALAAAQVSLPTPPLEPAQIPLSSLENHLSHELPEGSLATKEVKMGVAVMAEAETGQPSGVAKSEALPFAGNNKGDSQTLESEKNEVSQQQCLTAMSEVPSTVEIDVKVENGALDLESKAVIPPQDNPITATSENLAAGEKPLSSSQKDTCTECKTISMDPVDESESNNNLEEQEEDPEEDAEEDPEEDPEEEVEDDPEEQNE